MVVMLWLVEDLGCSHPHNHKNSTICGITVGIGLESTGNRRNTVDSIGAIPRSPLTYLLSPGPQVHPSNQASQVPHTWHRPHSPRWPIPWQACRPHQQPRPGCPPRNRSIQSQRCPNPTRQRTICHRHIYQVGRVRIRQEGFGEGLEIGILQQR